MQRWIRLFKPPEWDFFSAIQKTIYFAILAGGILLAKWITSGLFFLVFGY
jgi:hypothetical protein